MKRWPLILLIVSLVANVFLIGLVAGSVWRWTHGHGGGGPRNGWRMHAAEALPQPQSDGLRSALRQTVHDSLPVIRAGRAARAEAAGLFVQPQLDVAATSNALDRARAADLTLRTQLEHRLVIFAGTLPLDQRRKLAEALKAGPLRQGRPR